MIYPPASSAITTIIIRTISYILIIPLQGKQKKEPLLNEMKSLHICKNIPNYPCVRMLGSFKSGLEYIPHTTFVLIMSLLACFPSGFLFNILFVVYIFLKGGVVVFSNSTCSGFFDVFFL